MEPGNTADGGPCVSGVRMCPCCGYDTMVSDLRVPELCDLCNEAECDESGVSPCQRTNEDEYTDPREDAWCGNLD